MLAFHGFMHAQDMYAHMHMHMYTAEVWLARPSLILHLYTHII